MLLRKNKFEQELIDNGICPSCRGDLQVSISTTEVGKLYRKWRDSTNVGTVKIMKDHERSWCI